MITFEDLQNDLDRICNDLKTLIRTPGPSQAVARISDNDPRVREDFPMTKTMKELVATINKQDNINIYIKEDHGNIVLVGGFQHEPTHSEIRSIPTVIGAHLDEITYLISNKPKIEESYTLIPLCCAPTRQYDEKNHPFKHEEAAIYGFREKELVPLGRGKFHAIRKVEEDKRTHEKKYGEWAYLLNVHEAFKAIHVGDVAIQDYGTSFADKHYDINSEINAKALDDRVGSIVAIYALKYLACSNPSIPVKVILAGDEEGVGLDVSWARLVKPTYEKFCESDVVTILCDGIDGWNLNEFSENRRNEVLSEALLVPYTSDGKGAGDYGLFSLLRDKVIPMAESQGHFEVKTTTDYVSRSFDPKIMNEFPLIAFIDWSNGRVGNRFARCHQDEIVKVRQILNLIGMITYSVKYLHERQK